MTRSTPLSRRAMLRVAAGWSTAAVSGLSGCIQIDIPKNPASSAHSRLEFTLGAQVSGWKGIEPTEIADERNPTLNLVSGDRIELTWRNLDGQEHRLVIEDSLGKTLVESEASAERDETRTLSFEATEEMTTYLCAYHTVQMRGNVLVTTD